MVKVTNNGLSPEEFHVSGGKPGAPKFVSVPPGETQDLDLADRNSAHNRGREAAGLVVIGGRVAKEPASSSGSAKKGESA